MAVDYRKVTHTEVRQFLAEAATEGSDLRHELVNAAPSKLKSILKKQFNVVFVGTEKIPDPPRRIPTAAECRQLIEIFGVDDEFAEAMYSRASSSLAPLIMVFGHAMPLVVTARSEVAAAG